MPGRAPRARPHGAARGTAALGTAGRRHARAHAAAPRAPPGRCAARRARPQQTPLITSRYWPSIDAELARARWLADGAAEGEAAEANLSRQRVGGVYAVLKPATHVEALRVQLLEPEAAHGPLGEKERHALLHAAREDVAAAERAVVASGVLGQYRLDRGYRGSAREQAALRERYRPLGPSADAAARSGEWTHF